MRAIVKTYSSLLTVNILNIAFPIITIPVLLAAMGLREYGEFAYMQYLSAATTILVNYGFQILGINLVAARKQDIRQSEQIVSSILTIQLSISVMVLMIVSGIYFALPNYRNEIEISVVILSILNGIFLGLFPSWLFQGLNRSQEMIAPNIIGKGLTLAAILSANLSGYLNVKSAVASYALGSLATLILIKFALREFGIKRNSIEVKLIQRLIIEGGQVFVSRIIILLYVLATPNLLKYSNMGTEAVGIYNLLDRILTLLRMPFDIYSNTFYPIFSEKYEKTMIKVHLKRLIYTSVPLTVCLVFASWILSRINANTLNLDLLFLSIYILSMIPISIHGFIGNCVLITNGFRVSLVKSVSMGGLAYIVTVMAFSYLKLNMLNGILTAMFAVELTILVARWREALRYSLI